MILTMLQSMTTIVLSTFETTLNLSKMKWPLLVTIIALTLSNNVLALNNEVCENDTCQRPKKKCTNFKRSDFGPESKSIFYGEAKGETRKNIKQSQIH